MRAHISISYNTNLMIPTNLREELTEAVSGLKWDVKGIIHTDNTIDELPAESRVVTEIFQSMIIKKLVKWGKSKGIKVEDNALFGRGYPDVTLSCDNKELVALDIKSARMEDGDKISRMTLGTFDGYFLHPDEKLLHAKTKCYNDYKQHWVISVIYKWDPSKKTDKMVEIVSTPVGQKWQFAGKVAGSGDTANIGGITSLKKLQDLESDFKNEKEFGTYWRHYATKHPRKRTKIP